MKLNNVLIESDLQAVLSLMRKLEIYDADADKAKDATPEKLKQMRTELEKRYHSYMNEDMTGADLNRQQVQQSQNPRLLYSQQFMKAKQLAMGIAKLLDQHANQDRDIDVEGQVGDMGHVIEELNKIYNFLAHK